MILIIGLGNPGKKYKKTRHNIGFQVIDDLVKTKKWKKSKKANCFHTKKSINGKGVEFIKPLDFMNNSGKSVKYIQKKHNVKTKNIIVIHDDIDLSVGKLKICQNRSSAGHKGVQSIIDELGTQNFTRFRIGIHSIQTEPVQIDVEKFVLKKFTKNEQKIVKNVIKTTVEAISLCLKQGREKAMSKYN